MDLNLIKSLHIAGALALFSAFGSLLLGNAHRKFASMLHGISLLVILLAGFAMLGKPPMGQGWWVAKLGAWLLLGLAPIAVRRKWLPAGLAWGLCLAIAALAAWLGLSKRF